MARDLTTEVPESTIEKQAISKVFVDLAYNQDGTVDLENSTLGYRVINLPSGSERGFRTEVGTDIPTAVRTNIRALLNQMYADADSNGLLEPGTDSDDI